jgi:uncharacterized protein (DUF2062 family)
MQWDNFINILYPWLLGSVIIAIPFTLLSYVATLIFMYYREKKNIARRNHHPHFSSLP